MGWLDPLAPFPIGVPDNALIEKLFFLADTQAANVMRILGRCVLCGAEVYPALATRENQILGCAEIWVPSILDPSRVLAAPDLIIHYIEVHHYQPPEEFIKSVAAVDPDQWNGAVECERIINAACLLHP